MAILDASGRLAQTVRALPSHGRGRGFESLIAHHDSRKPATALVHDAAEAWASGYTRLADRFTHSACVLLGSDVKLDFEEHRDDRPPVRCGVASEQVRTAWHKTRGPHAMRDWRLELALSVSIVVAALFVLPLAIVLVCTAGAVISGALRFAYFYAQTRKASPA